MSETNLVMRPPLPPIEAGVVQNVQRSEKTAGAPSGGAGADTRAAARVSWMHNALGAHDPNKLGLVLASERDANAGVTDIFNDSAAAANLRRQENSAHKPFEGPDRMDRFYIWLRHSPPLFSTQFLKKAALVWNIGLAIRGWYTLRYGWGKSDFAKMATPGNPVNGVFYQEKETDPSHNLMHALNAYAGEPNTITEEALKDLHQVKAILAPDGSLQDYWMEGRLDEIAGNGHVRTLIDFRDWHEEAADRIDEISINAASKKASYKEVYSRVVTEYAKSRCDEINEDCIEKEDQGKKMLVGVKLRGKSGLGATVWTALREDGSISAHSDKAKEKWTLLDSKQGYLDAKKGKQPKFADVSDYIEYLAHRDDVEEAKVFYRSRDFIRRQGDFS